MSNENVGVVKCIRVLLGRIEYCPKVTVDRQLLDSGRGSPTGHSLHQCSSINQSLFCMSSTASLASPASTRLVQLAWPVQGSEP